MKLQLDRRSLLVVSIVGIIGISIIFTIFLPPKYEVIETSTFTYNGIEIQRLDASGFRFTHLIRNFTVYVDPYDLDSIAFLTGQTFEQADYIFVTHGHANHHSYRDIWKVLTNETILVMYQAAEISASTLYPHNTIHYVLPNETVQFSNLIIETVPMYNINKYRYGTTVFHPKGENDVVPILDFGETMNGSWVSDARIYHAGDSDLLPEMKSIVCDIALLPVAGYALMTPEEAATAVEYLKLSSDLRYAIPFHYDFAPQPLYLGKEAAITFSKRAKCDVVILENSLA